MNLFCGLCYTSVIARAGWYGLWLKILIVNTVNITGAYTPDILRRKK